MGRNKKQVSQQNPESSRKDAFSHVDEEILPPETAEDFLLVALEEENLAGIVRMLRDLYGSKEIRSALRSLSHRDPVDRFTHIRRHAVELYAKRHDITPATLMVKLKGVKGRADAVGSERYKLRRAREYLKQDREAHIGALALAEHWENCRKMGWDSVTHLKGIAPEV